MGDVVISSQNGVVFHISHADFERHGIALHEKGTAVCCSTVYIPLTRELVQPRSGGSWFPAIAVSHPYDPSECNRRWGDHFSISNSPDVYLKDQPAGENKARCEEEEFWKLPDGTKLYVSHLPDNAIIEGQARARTLRRELR